MRGQRLDSWPGLTQRRSRLRPLLALAVACLVAWGAYSWWAGSGKADHKKPAVPVALAAAVAKDMPVYLDGLGTVQAYNTVTVHSQVDGQLINVLFTEGQPVKKGDVLAKIDPRTYQAQLDQAVATKGKDEAQLANAQHDLERYINLGNNISGQILDTQRALVRQLEATVKADQAAIDNARALLSYTTIASPISGRTGIRQVDAGNIVHAGDANGIVVVTQLQPISVIFSLPQQQLEAINAQIAAQGTLKLVALGSDGKTEIDRGTLELVDNQIDQTTGTIRLKATFPNEKMALWPGGFVNVRLLLDTQKDAIVIPTVAVQRGPKGMYVFAVKSDDTVEMRPVTVGLAEGDETVISDGLKEGEQVVVDGMAKLQDGSKVQALGVGLKALGKKESPKPQAVSPTPKALP